MAHTLYHRNLKKILDRTLDLTSGEFSWMIVGTGYTPNPDHEFVADVVANEISASGYSGGYGGTGRHDAGSLSFGYDDTNDRAYVDTADPASWTIASGPTGAYAILLKKVTSDALSPILCCIDIVNYAFDGTPYTLQVNASGAFAWKATP